MNTVRIFLIFFTLMVSKAMVSTKPPTSKDVTSDFKRSMPGLTSGLKLITSGYGSKALVFNVENSGDKAPKISFDQAVWDQEFGAMTAAYYIPKFSSLYTVNETMGSNGTVSRWKVDLTGENPVLARKEVSGT